MSHRFMKHLHIASPTHTIAHRLIQHCSYSLVGCFRHHQNGTHHINVSEYAVYRGKCPPCMAIFTGKWWHDKPADLEGLPLVMGKPKPSRTAHPVNLMDYGLVEGSSRRLHGHGANLSSGWEHTWIIRAGGQSLFSDRHPFWRWRYIDEATWGKCIDATLKGALTRSGLLILYIHTCE